MNATDGTDATTDEASDRPFDTCVRCVYTLAALRWMETPLNRDDAKNKATGKN